MSELLDPKRVGKNTLFMYIRMLLLLVISLYTSRVVLSALGASDYGIYNVVGGFVVMFGMISNSITASVSRFITFSIGQGDHQKIKSIFNTSLFIQCMISITIIVIAETIGLWFVNNRIVLPEDRLVAANWCYQLSIISFIINLLTTPFSAFIIANEKMSVYAYLGVAEGVFRLLIALLIVSSKTDRLILYSILTAGLTLGVRFFYIYYCKRFKECRFARTYDKRLCKEMFSFAGWNFIGASSYVLREQGCNVLINLFFGPVVNAARGIAVNVNTAVSNFVQNFMVALDPQITKSYASGSYDYLSKIVTQGSRFSFFILSVLIIPLLVCTETILGLWLKEVPDHTVLFVRLILLLTLTDVLSTTLTTLIQARGDIRNYQLTVGVLQMMNFPISYLLLKWGCIPEVIVIVAIVISFICFVSRLFFVRSIPSFSIKTYVEKAFVKPTILAILSLSLPLFFKMQFEKGIISSLAIFAFSFLWTCSVLWFCGLNKSERVFVRSKISSFFDNLLNKK